MHGVVRLGGTWEVSLLAILYFILLHPGAVALVPSCLHHPITLSTALAGEITFFLSTTKCRKQKVYDDLTLMFVDIYVKFNFFFCV